MTPATGLMTMSSVLVHICLRHMTRVGSNFKTLSWTGFWLSSFGAFPHLIQLCTKMWHTGKRNVSLDNFSSLLSIELISSSWRWALCNDLILIYLCIGLKNTPSGDGQANLSSVRAAEQFPNFLSEMFCREVGVKGDHDFEFQHFQLPRHPLNMSETRLFTYFSKQQQKQQTQKKCGSRYLGKCFKTPKLYLNIIATNSCSKWKAAFLSVTQKRDHQWKSIANTCINISLASLIVLHIEIQTGRCAVCSSLTQQKL